MRKTIDYDGIVAGAWHSLAIESNGSMPDVQGGFTVEGERVLCLRGVSGVLVANLETREVTLAPDEDEVLVQTHALSGPNAADPAQRSSSFGFLCERLRAQ